MTKKYDTQKKLTVTHEVKIYILALWMYFTFFTNFITFSIKLKHQKIPYMKTFLTWMEKYLIYSVHFTCGVSSLLRNKTVSPWHSTRKKTCSWNTNTLKNTSVFQTVCIPFVSANEKICKNKYFHYSFLPLIWICFSLNRTLISSYCLPDFEWHSTHFSLTIIQSI